MNYTTAKSRKIRVIETEVYSRVVGYYRPVQNWNEGKQMEFSQRNLMSLESQRLDSGKFIKLVG
ncbi:anaerobic ribonucleoside-triphosphate reductase [Myxococcota bacterium]|nr:anaerobic ribonucleoside-triphosphate reductase [Myxococcota bacterium]MBU1381807.1 anaerobic ribonucleoside-triphosphate reductase [Myxococcota bacterium]MBU1498584.1 anaerobic ribonucleoside-triphosphate reductase [Myxococcota bacterium]